MKTIDELAIENQYPYKLKYGMWAVEITENISRNSFKKGVEIAQRWIPIEEELPVYYKPVNVKFGILETTAWRAWSETSGDLYTINGTDVIMENTPTHWRPLELK